MKPLLSKLPKICLLLLAVTLIQVTASAHTVRSREARVVVTAIQQEQRVLQLRFENDNREMEMVWKKQTKFFFTDRLATIEELTVGTKAVVYYRTPVFGKRFITRMRFEDGR